MTKQTTTRTVLGPNYFAQLAAAAKQQRAMHEQLLAAGARWDGMDGYDLTVAPDAK